MYQIENIFGQSKIDREQLCKAGEIICQCCNGTGINPDYKEVNIIQTSIDELAQEYKDYSKRLIHSANTAAPYCLSCYGMKKIDWIQYATGSYKQELIDRSKDVRNSFLQDVEPFLDYISYGEVWPKFDAKTKYLRFDFEKKCWFETSGLNDDFDGLKAAYKWLNKFKAVGYFDLGTIVDNIHKHLELYLIEPEQYFQDIKTELILSRKVTIERLIEIKNDLDLFWYNIQDLDHISINGNVNGKLANEFKFTWANIFRRFGLQPSHIESFNSKVVNPQK